MEDMAPLHGRGGAYANTKKEEEGKDWQALAFANMAVVREREGLAEVFSANAIGRTRRTIPGHGLRWPLRS